MTHCLKLLTCLTPLCAVAALAQTENAQSNSTAAPTAFVYVARPTHIDGFAVSSSGKLTPVPGSPFANIAVSHLSATTKFLFGSGDNGQDIYTFAIASNGSIKQVAATNPHNYDPSPCTALGPIQLDHTGATLYNYDSNCENGSGYTQSFKIESNGDLQFLANAEGAQGGLSQVEVLGNNKFAYQEGTTERPLHFRHEAGEQWGSGSGVHQRGAAVHRHGPQLLYAPTHTCRGPNRSCGFRRLRIH